MQHSVPVYNLIVHITYEYSVVATWLVIKGSDKWLVVSGIRIVACFRAEHWITDLCTDVGQLLCNVS